MSAAGLIIIPFIDCWQETHRAALDAMLQLQGDADVLLIDQGSTGVAQTGAEMLALTYKDQVRLWRHAPPMPSLSATWNAALEYAWELGHQDAMVWNNDIRVAAHMYTMLRQAAIRYGLWFTTPVNCLGAVDPAIWQTPVDIADTPLGLGGPDFSCFLISQECHRKYPFDERFQPAYHEDGDMHRRQWLGGDGSRIAGVTLPYLHYGSRTINRSNEAASAFSPLFEACRRRYIEKWGGAPHHERKITPDSTEDFDGVGTPGGYLDMIPPHYGPPGMPLVPVAEERMDG